MAVSMIRKLKEVDVVDINNIRQGVPQRSWVLYDPLGGEARFPGSPLT